MAIYLSEKKEEEKEKEKRNEKSYLAGKKKTHYWLLTDILRQMKHHTADTFRHIPFSATNTWNQQSIFNNFLLSSTITFPIIFFRFLFFFSFSRFSFNFILDLPIFSPRWIIYIFILLSLIRNWHVLFGASLRSIFRDAWKAVRTNAWMKSSRIFLRSKRYYLSKARRRAWRRTDPASNSRVSVIEAELQSG